MQKRLYTVTVVHRYIIYTAIDHHRDAQNIV